MPPNLSEMWSSSAFDPNPISPWTTKCLKCCLHRCNRMPVTSSWLSLSKPTTANIMGLQASAYTVAGKKSVLLVHNMKTSETMFGSIWFILVSEKTWPWTHTFWYGPSRSDVNRPGRTPKEALPSAQILTPSLVISCHLLSCCMLLILVHLWQVVWHFRFDCLTLLTLGPLSKISLRLHPGNRLSSRDPKTNRRRLLAAQHPRICISLRNSQAGMCVPQLIYWDMIIWTYAIYACYHSVTRRQSHAKLGTVFEHLFSFQSCVTSPARGWEERRIRADELLQRLQGAKVPWRIGKLVTQAMEEWLLEAVCVPRHSESGYKSHTLKTLVTCWFVKRAKCFCKWAWSFQCFEGDGGLWQWKPLPLPSTT